MDAQQEPDNYDYIYDTCMGIIDSVRQFFIFIILTMIATMKETWSFMAVHFETYITNGFVELDNGDYNQILATVYDGDVINISILTMAAVLFMIGGLHVYWIIFIEQEVLFLTMGIAVGSLVSVWVIVANVARNEIRATDAARKNHVDSSDYDSDKDKSVVTGIDTGNETENSTGKGTGNETENGTGKETKNSTGKETKNITKNSTENNTGATSDCVDISKGDVSFGVNTLTTTGWGGWGYQLIPDNNTHKRGGEFSNDNGDAKRQRRETASDPMEQDGHYTSADDHMND